MKVIYLRYLLLVSFTCNVYTGFAQNPKKTFQTTINKAGTVNIITNVDSLVYNRPLPFDKNIYYLGIRDLSVYYRDSLGKIVTDTSVIEHSFGSPDSVALYDIKITMIDTRKIDSVYIEGKKFEPIRVDKGFEFKPTGMRNDRLTILPDKKTVIFSANYIPPKYVLKIVFIKLDDKASSRLTITGAGKLF